MSWMSYITTVEEIKAVVGEGLVTINPLAQFVEREEEWKFASISPFAILDLDTKFWICSACWNLIQEHERVWQNMHITPEGPGHARVTALHEECTLPTDRRFD